MIGVQRRPTAFDTVIWCYPRRVGNVTKFQPGGILIRKQEWQESTHNKKQNMKRRRERPTWKLENQSSAQTVQSPNPSYQATGLSKLGNPGFYCVRRSYGKYLPTGAFDLSTSTY